MKIFFTIDSLQTGGAERSTLEITKRLTADITPVVVTFYKNNELEAEFVSAGVRVEKFRLNGKYDFRTGIKLFTALCQQEQPDLIVATLFRSEYISRMVGRKLNIPVIGTFVNDTYSKYAISALSFSMKVKTAFFWLLNKWSSRFCYRFLANSESIKANNAKTLFISTDRIDVIPRGRDVSKYSFKEERFTGENTVFLNVGRLIPRKGQREMIVAFAKFAKEFPNAELWIAGEGQFRHELSSLIEELEVADKVKLLGNVSNVPELLRQADVFVFPSWYEGFSGAIVEAMLAGVPIIASDISMNREAVEHQYSAVLFKVQSSSSIYEAMKFSIEEKQLMLQFARNAREKALAEYNIETVSQKHAAYYTAIVHRLNSNHLTN